MKLFLLNKFEPFSTITAIFFIITLNLTQGEVVEISLDTFDTKSVKCIQTRKVDLRIGLQDDSFMRITKI